MNLLKDIITYVRRIIKSPSDAIITDSLIVDYINRFWIMDVDARIQLFDLKTKYQFQTVPGYDQYNMPMYGIQVEPGFQNISYYPVYQGFLDPVYINGIQVPFQTDKTTFFNIWPNVVQQMNVVATGDGGSTYSFTFPISPNNSAPLNAPFQYILRGHIDTTGIIALANSAFNSFTDPSIVTNLEALDTSIALGTITSVPASNVFPAVYITSNSSYVSSIVVTDSGQFLSGNTNYGLLMEPGINPPGTVTSPTGNLPLPAPGIGLDQYSITSNTINYFTGQVNVTFPVPIPAGVNINAQCFLFQCGLPRGVLFWNNTLVFRSPPDRQ